jgi:hypothetical protein
VKCHLVKCDICGASLVAGSLQSHLKTQHDTYQVFVLNQELTVECESWVYWGRCHWHIFLPCAGLCGCHVLQSYSLITLSLMPPPVLPKEGSLPLPQCNRCGLQIFYKTMNGGHYETALCKDGVARKVQHAAAERVHLALKNMFTAYGEGLERVEVFKYLERLLAYDDNNSQAVRGNLKKVQGIWARISRTLRAEIVSPRVCSIIYKATLQSILLFGSETWNLSPVSLKVLEGFHIRVVWRMAGKRPMKLCDGTWTYPNSVDVLKDIGLETIAHYIAVHW